MGRIEVLATIAAIQLVLVNYKIDSGHIAGGIVRYDSG